MTKEKHITRYGQEQGQGYTFKGWRLCLTRNGERFVRYFSDLKSGGAEKALADAVAMRDVMLAELAADGADSHEIFNRYRRLGNEC
ncbi:MAG: hypothetical protein IJ503_00315 [Akkermansia sp.]|nr:hypothetical protein [Akkermansia sp.]MDO5465096.1 hypothetical protein [Akkermansia sp.]